MTKAQARRFAAAWLRSMDPQHAARAAGAPDALLARADEAVRREIRRGRELLAREFTPEDTVRRMTELAFGRANDCVRLALDPAADVDSLDLSLLQEIKRNDSTHEVILATARTVICQLDTLTYAVFAADSIKNGYGINCTEFANFIVKTFPDCKVAYNLDGGASSRLYMGQKRVNTAKGRREIYGMVYFASAASED